MSASTTKILLLLLFTGSLVSAGGCFRRGKKKGKSDQVSGEKTGNKKPEKQGGLWNWLMGTKKTNTEAEENAAKKTEAKKITNALLKETYENSINKSNIRLINRPMTMKRNDDKLYTNIINIETQKISDKVKNKKNGSDLYKMSRRPATKIPTKENIAQSQMKELKKNNAANWSKTQEKNARKENNAATKIQTLFREKLTRNRLKELKANKEEQEKKNNAATKIQTLVRGKLARDQLKELKADKEKKNNAAATNIQKVHRGNKDRKQVKELKADKEQEKKNNAATKIQTLLREKLARNQLKELKNTKQNKKNVKKHKKRAAKKALEENNAATDSAQEKELKDDYNIETIRVQTDVSKEKAISLLKEAHGDVGEAVMNYYIEENRDNVQLKVDDRAKHAFQASVAKYAAGEKRRQEKAVAKN